MIHQQLLAPGEEPEFGLVFSENIPLFGSEQVTTDIGRTTAELDQVVRIPFDEGQEVTAILLGGCFFRVGGVDPFSLAKVELFVNGRKLFEQRWPFGRTEPICPELSTIDPAIFKFDGSENLIKVRFTQSPFDGLNTWSFSGNLLYNGNTFEPPSRPPSTGPVIVEPDPTGGQSKGPIEQLQDALFGDVRKTVGTIIIAAVVIAGAVVVVSLTRKSPQAKAAGTLKRVGRGRAAI